MARPSRYPLQATSAHSYRDTAEGWRMLREIADARQCSDGEASRQLVREAYRRLTRRAKAAEENDPR